MKTVIVNKETVFENDIALMELVKENGYDNFEIGEAITLYKEEIEFDLADEVLEDNVPYICHTGILNDNDEEFYILITTDFTDDINNRYRPISFVDLDGGNKALIVFK